MVHDSITTAGPLFRRIADALADAMARGDYPVGSRLPPEFTLMRMFGASRFTIREALVDLRSRGLVASRRGSGTTVLRRTPQPPPEFAAIYRSIDEFLPTQIPLQPIEIRDVIADEALAAELRCEPGRQFLLFRGIRRSPAGVMSRLGLKLNETKTCLRNACKERFDFLGPAAHAFASAAQPRLRITKSSA